MSMPRSAMVIETAASRLMQVSARVVQIPAPGVVSKTVRGGALTPGLGHVESSSCWRKRDDQDYGQEELLR